MRIGGDENNSEKVIFQCRGSGFTRHKNIQPECLHWFGQLYMLRTQPQI